MAKKKRKPIKPVKHAKSIQKKTKAVIKKTSKKTAKEVKPIQKKVPVAIPSKPKLSKAQLKRVTDLMQQKGETVNSQQDILNFYIKYEKVLKPYLETDNISFEKSANKLFEDIDVAELNGYTFILNGKEVSGSKLKYEISLTDLWLSNEFDVIGSQYTYTLNGAGELKMILPKRERNPELKDESHEVITDYFMNEYGLLAYLYETNTKQKRLKQQRYAEEYRESAIERKRDIKRKNSKKNERKRTK